MSIIDRNDNFCAAPWVTIHVEPNGGASPCCISPSKSPDEAVYGNLHKDSFNDVLHGQKLKDFRKQFMNNEQPVACNACWDKERTFGKHSSLRNNFNVNRFKEQYYLDTADDGTYDMKITYWDFRPSNRCNLACLMCCSELSSGYYQLQKDLGLNLDTEQKFLEISDERFEEIFAHMKENLRTHSNETHFYFAGGEPLQIPQHHKILDHLVENKYYDVSLRYNTNLTTLNYKQTDWVDVWSRFDKVVIDASIDAAGPAGEFQRMNSKWSVVKDNIKRLADANIVVSFNAVVTMITYPYIIDTINELEEIFSREYLHNNLRFIGTEHPEHLRLTNTPREFIDDTILDKMDELGYSSASVRGYLSRYNEDNVDKSKVNARWRRVVLLNDRLRKVKGVGFNDVLPWFDEYVKGKNFHD